jgi:hypothetical protein
MSSETSTGLASPKSSTPNVLSGLFWRKQRKKSPIAWLCAVGTGRFGWGAIRAGNPPSDGQRQAMQERGRRLTKANRSLLSDVGRVGPVPLPVRRRASKIGRLLSPQVSSAGGSDVVTSAGFLEKAAQEVPKCMALRCRSCPFRMGAIRTGDALPTNGDNNTGTRRRLATANRSLCSRPRKLWGGSLSCPKEAVENR